MDLIGKWVFEDGELQPSRDERRIGDLLKGVLVEVCDSDDGWEKLLRDPSDESLFVLSYLESESHGAGPRRLRSVSVEEARQKFDF